MKQREYFEETSQASCW